MYCAALAIVKEFEFCLLASIAASAVYSNQLRVRFLTFSITGLLGYVDDLQIINFILLSDPLAPLRTAVFSEKLLFIIDHAIKTYAITS